tara:strand:- start:185 stop:478 length:294 start_codon:yes stop_codon:yes gene_type:complete
MDKLDKHAREEFAKICRKNGDFKSARRYEAGLYNSLGAIDIDVVDDLLAEVKRWKENWTFFRDWLVKHINNEKTNPTARVFSEFFLQLMDGRDEVSE